MLPSDAFRINTSRVAHQTLDGEAIIIDFDSGTYYSTGGSGAIIWQEIASNAPVSGIVETLNRKYMGDAETIRHSLDQFLDELEREALIERRDDVSLTPRASSAAPDKESAARPAFETPSLHKFTDMQDLLLLDAIHNTDPQGWPIKADSRAV